MEICKLLSFTPIIDLCKALGNFEKDAHPTVAGDEFNTSGGT